MRSEREQAHQEAAAKANTYAKEMEQDRMQRELVHPGLVHTRVMAQAELSATYDAERTIDDIKRKSPHLF